MKAGITYSNINILLNIDDILAIQQGKKQIVSIPPMNAVVVISYDTGIITPDNLHGQEMPQ